MDDIDRAQERETAYRDRALDGVRAAAARLCAPTTSTVLCGCGDPIELERRRVVPGAKTCISCALAFERRSKLYRSS